MTKFMTARVAGLVIAGATLLTACTGTQSDKTAQGTPSKVADNAPIVTSVAPTATSSADATVGANATRRPSSTTTRKTEEPLSQVRCGPVEVGPGRTHVLIADPTPAGIVGCTVAFNVLDEYVKAPASKKTGPFSEMELSNGWICGADDGKTAAISCTSKRDIGDKRNPDALALHTVPGSS